MSYGNLRGKILETGHFLIKNNLTVGSSGNISVRIPNENKVLITPSMIPFTKMTSDDLLLIDLDGNVIEGERNPSVETPMHLSIYKKRNEINAIIHAHPIYSSAFAVAHKTIPPIIDELVVYTGGEIQLAKYALPGTEELAENVVNALGNRKAVLLSNHGILVCGKDLDDAVDVLLKVERTAKIYILAKILGEPKMLPKEAIEAEKEMYEIMQL